MTEDNTFRELKRIPFSEVCRLITIHPGISSTMSTTTEELEKYGWTDEEFKKAWIDSLANYKP